MKFRMMFGAAVSLLIAVPAAHASNVALISDGASFVSASSAIDLATGPSLTTMQNDVISSNPTPWLSNGDTRYIFGTNDASQTLTIELGSTQSLTSFAATDVDYDRVISGLTVSTSTDGVAFTPVAGVATYSDANSVGRFTLAAPTAVEAKYVEYGFGPSSIQYGDGGSAVSQVFATAVSAAPEPAAWALMIAGVAMVGAALRLGRRHGAMATA